MTLLYSLFNVPGNLKEFINKTKKQDRNQLDIFYSIWENTDSFAPISSYAKIGVRSGKSRFIIDEYFYLGRNIKHIDKDLFIRNIIPIVYEIKGAGLIATINGRLSSDEMVKRLNDK